MADPSFIDAYRSAAQDIPRPVGVLACSLGSARYAITVDSFLDVSYDPPTMALSVYSGSRMAEQLSILASQQKGIAQWLGEPGQPVRGLLDPLDTAEAPSGSPVVSGAVAWFDLRITQRVEVATHTILAAAVTAVGSRHGSDPLVHWADAYHRPAPR
jgi:flavin reductase (DIM6/NTAB) family NADH-FMN oxidoreductase RutF